MTEVTSIETLHHDSRNRPSFRNNALLGGISDGIYAELTDKIRVIQCSPNEIIFEENDSGDSLYLIAEGSVKISKRGRAGQQETLAYLMECDFFGEMALVDTGQRSAQAAAVGHVVVGRIDREGWDLLLQLAPQQVLANFTRSVTKRLRHNNQHFIEEVMRKRAPLARRQHHQLDRPRHEQPDLVHPLRMRSDPEEQRGRFNWRSGGIDPGCGQKYGKHDSRVDRFLARQHPTKS